MAQPTIKAWTRYEIKPFHTEITGTWRWGTEKFSVFYDTEDQSKLWGICWRDTTDDGDDQRKYLSDSDFFEVVQVERLVVDYVAKKPG